MLALAALVLAGGAATAWPDAPPAVEVHGTAHASETPAESGAEEEAFHGAPAVAVGPAAHPAPPGARRAAPVWMAAPAVPPPE
ncbi:hypothetical protein [Rubrivirga litoralis]|uniref:Uncharacterized protein n=1 Tax=Rubrivirga litoralis TaxID=3075598 RepID=A0ABU3BMQ8_9BACT|nr:hypothetical protein [Rubrivirga sp. F394]MDT0630550.1 hypothetical protein [Rubrivirga sp. F394]